jgi:multiple sugar transport system substrate-binding protein
MTSRGFRAIALFCSVLVAASACGGVGGGDDEPIEAGKGPLSTIGFSLPDEIAKARVEIFKRENPEVNLTITEGGFDEQQFLSAVASGNPPDLVYFDRKLVGTYARRGSIMPLDDCIKKQKIDMGQYRPAARAQVTFNEKVYGIPEFYSVRVVYMNEAVLKEAGMTANDVNFGDWASLAAANAKLAKVSGGRLDRIGIDPKLPEFLPLWAKANGVDILSADGKTPRLNDPKVVEALAAGLKLINDQGGWGTFKSFRDTFDFFGAESPLAKNLIAVWPMEEWFVNVAARNTPNAQIVVKPFTDRQGKPLTMASGQTWAIPKGAKNPDAACTFMMTMTRTSTWVDAAKARLEARKAAGAPFTGVFTGNVNADREIFTKVYQPSGNKRFDDGVQTILQAQDVAFSIPASPAGAEFDKAWYDAANRVLSAGADPAAALDQAQREAQAAFDRAK